MKQGEEPMRVGRFLRIAFGSVLAGAILAVPGAASAQSLFGTQTPTISSPPAASPPTTARKTIVKRKTIVRRRRRRRAVPTNASRVTVINKRAVTLVELSVISKTAKDAKPQIVAHDLAGGKKASARLAKKGGCIYAVSGKFADHSTVEAATLDLCKDNNLNLVE